MHSDAKVRLRELAEDARGPRTEKGRIRALLPEIEAARLAGRTWTEIGDALGVARSTLFAALRGAKTTTPSTSTEVVAAKAKVEEARPKGEPVVRSKIKRWGE